MKDKTVSNRGPADFQSCCLVRLKIQRHENCIKIPFVNMHIDLGVLYIPFITFIAVGTVNAVNLTDGLDGLNTGVTLIVMAAFSLMQTA